MFWFIDFTDLDRKRDHDWEHVIQTGNRDG